MLRWPGRGNRVMAMSKVHVPFRRNASGEPASVTIPDHVDNLYELTNGAQVHMRASETTGLSTGNQTWMYGSEGTIYVDRRQNVFAGRRGNSQLSEVPNPPADQAYSRVEEEFINAIRGVEEVTMVPFETGVHYMEWTDVRIYVRPRYRSSRSRNSLDARRQRRRHHRRGPSVKRGWILPGALGRPRTSSTRIPRERGRG